ncbi:Two-component response regulator ARR8 [Platanthera guangdongensis]|uniref:Two-component response regulator ARR8 n=1 Tax=Platanthera guangdongensis TaxID=2320717 RepID=A0ABR2LSV5_9ASPA
MVTPEVACKTDGGDQRGMIRRWRSVGGSRTTNLRRWTTVGCLEGGADEFFLKPVQLSDMQKLRPHILKGKSQESSSSSSKSKFSNDNVLPEWTRIRLPLAPCSGMRKAAVPSLLRLLFARLHGFTAANVILRCSEKNTAVFLSI